MATRTSVPRARSAAVLWLALMVVAVTGCSSKPTLTPEQQADTDLAAYNAEIRKVVSDPARADQLVALSDEFRQLAEETALTAKRYQAQAAALNSNYETTRADYEALFARQDATRDAFIRKAGSLRDRMAALTTDSEWDRLTKARLRALEDYLQQLHS